ncbi:unnamed protein product, partial [Symbiodinium microadriaticum]
SISAFRAQFAQHISSPEAGAPDDAERRSLEHQLNQVGGGWRPKEALLVMIAKLIGVMQIHFDVAESPENAARLKDRLASMRQHGFVTEEPLSEEDFDLACAAAERHFLSQGLPLTEIRSVMRTVQVALAEITEKGDKPKAEGEKKDDKPQAEGEKKDDKPKAEGEVSAPLFARSSECLSACFCPLPPHPFDIFAAASSPLVIASVLDPAAHLAQEFDRPLTRRAETMEDALRVARRCAVELATSPLGGAAVICGFRVFPFSREGCHRMMTRLCDPAAHENSDASREASKWLKLYADLLGTGSLDFVHTQVLSSVEARLSDALLEVGRLLDQRSSTIPGTPEGRLEAARLLAIELVLDPLACDDVRLGMRVFGGSPAQAFRRLCLLCHPDKNGRSEQSVKATRELQDLIKLVTARPEPNLLELPPCRVEQLLREALRRVEEDKAGLASASSALGNRRGAGETAEPQTMGEEHTEPETMGEEQAEPEAVGEEQAEPEDVREDQDEPEDVYEDQDEPEDVGENDLGHYTDKAEDLNDEPPDGNLVGMELVWERVDHWSIVRALQLDAVRRAADGELFDILFSFYKRARKVGPDGVGWVPVLRRPGRCAPGLTGRLYSGVGTIPCSESPAKRRKGAVDEVRAAFVAQLPAEIQQELRMGVPDGLAGRSGFAFSKAIRYILRARLNSVEIDVTNSFLYGLPDILIDYVQNREDILHRISELLLPKMSDRRAKAKELMIALGFGGSFAKWCSRTLREVPLAGPGARGELVHWLYFFERSARQWHEELWQMLPEEAQQWHREEGRSFASAAFALYAHEERLVHDEMEKAADKQYIDCQHDGIGALRSAVQQVKASLPGIDLAVKELPDCWAFASAAHPNLDWQLVSGMDFEDYHALRHVCREHVWKGRARGNTVDFSKLAAALLQPVVHVPVEGGEKRTTYESFEKGGYWLTRRNGGPKDALLEVVQPAIAQQDAVPRGLPVQVREPRACQATKSRGSQAVEEGVLVQRLRGAVVHGEHRLAEVPEQLLDCLAQVVAIPKFYRSCCGPDMKAWTSLILVSFPDTTRLPASLPSSCSLPVSMYSFKKALMSSKMVVSLSGCHISELAAAWNPRRSREGPAPFHARLRGKRLAWASEVPDHFGMAEGFIKPFCDHEGAPVTSRHLHKGAKDFAPTALLVATSNSPPRVINPDGMLRRLRVCQTSVKFTRRPESATEAQAVDGLKAAINRGEYNKYLMYFAANLVDTLSEKFNPGSEIMPQPPDMKLSALDVMDDTPQPRENFLQERCVECPRAEAVEYSTLLDELIKWFSFEGPDKKARARTEANRLGIMGKSWGRRYIATSSKDGQIGGLKLRPAATSTENARPSQSFFPRAA